MNWFPYPARISSWQTTANPIAEENADSVHAPRDIAERGLKTRNMFKNLEGFPKSAMRRGAESSAPANAAHNPAVANGIQRRKRSLVIHSMAQWESGNFLGKEDSTCLLEAAKQPLTLVTYDRRTIP